MDYTFTDDKLDNSKPTLYTPCVNWKAGNPTKPGWQLSVTYHTKDSDDKLHLTTGRIYFSSDVGTKAGLYCVLSEYVFSKDVELRSNCKWSTN